MLRLKNLCILVFLLVAGCGYNNAYKDIHNLQASQYEQDLRLAALEAQMQGLEAGIAAAINAVNAGDTSLQTQINLMLVQLSVLQSNVQIMNIIDPCGDGPGFDEVLLKTSNGLLAYFENGNKRHLSLIPAGSYITTDQQQCVFTVDINGNVF